MARRAAAEAAGEAAPVAEEAVAEAPMSDAFAEMETPDEVEASLTRSKPLPMPSPSTRRTHPPNSPRKFTERHCCAIGCQVAQDLLTEWMHRRSVAICAKPAKPKRSPSTRRSRRCGFAAASSNRLKLGEFNIPEFAAIQIRGFMRNYARYLGLEEDRIVAYYEERADRQHQTATLKRTQC